MALQGAFAAHRRMLERCGATTVAIRQPAQLEGCDALVLPGGESTTMSNLAVRTGLFDAIARRLHDGMPALGTCAGAILLATTILDGRSDQRCFGALDVTVRRNGYGRQLASFETDLDVVGLGDPFHGVFIRAPKLEFLGAGVAALASVEEFPVLVRSGAIMAATFHPELSDDARIHRLFLDGI
ncbi:MAG: pyridoxal 5'-phosphate synthase glutaminase subunit PdxT [Microthrixaceae bacterium]|nr:pyridoxal 5'-phosphate synthase glutaminase subunit PdxT [Microthrixaceae bacterium]